MTLHNFGKTLLWLSEASRHRCSFSLYSVTLLGRTGEIFLNKVSYEISCFLTKCPWLKLSHSGMLFWDSFFYPAFPKRILIRGFLERCFTELWPSKEHHSEWNEAQAPQGFPAHVSFPWGKRNETSKKCLSGPTKWIPDMFSASPLSELKLVQASLGVGHRNYESTRVRTWDSRVSGLLSPESSY